MNKLANKGLIIEIAGQLVTSLKASLLVRKKHTLLGLIPYMGPAYG